MALDYQIIGKRIREERTKRNLTQEDMADNIDTSVAFYSRLETGRTPINLKRIVQIAEILNVPVGYFITGITDDTDDYLNQEFKNILAKCTPKKQKFILEIAELVANMM